MVAIFYASRKVGRETGPDRAAPAFHPADGHAHDRRNQRGNRGPKLPGRQLPPGTGLVGALRR